MKNFKIIFLFVALLSAGLSVSSCSNTTSKIDKSEKLGKEYTSAYICPMYCEGSGSEKSGNCPVCEMDYVKNKNHKQGNNNHEEHNH